MLQSAVGQAVPNKSVKKLDGCDGSAGAVLDKSSRMLTMQKSCRFTLGSSQKRLNVLGPSAVLSLSDVKIHGLMGQPCLVTVARLRLTQKSQLSFNWNFPDHLSAVTVAHNGLAVIGSAGLATCQSMLFCFQHFPIDFPIRHSRAADWLIEPVVIIHRHWSVRWWNCGGGAFTNWRCV